jgi:hypothetical protein
MQGERGSGGNKGGKGSGGSELRLRRDLLRGAFSFTSSISLASLFVATMFLVSACARSAPTEPGVVNFLIETMPTNLDPRIGTDESAGRSS